MPDCPIARLFDLWSTNLLSFVLPRLDRSANEQPSADGEFEGREAWGRKN